MSIKQYDEYLRVFIALWDPEDKGLNERQREFKRKFWDANPPELINHSQCRDFLKQKKRGRGGDG
eukprot:35882-Eustigmatos_ZCMA.PRE.1